jgi:cation diffusion facilitator family transporter
VADPAHPLRSRTAAIQWTLALILVLNLVVVAVKLVVGLRTGSLTVIGATLESSLDALNNVIAIVIVALAARGPDEDHPYGNDKFETVGALAIVGFLSISCFELLRGAVSRMLAPPPLDTPSLTEFALLGGTALVNVVVVTYERRRGRELGSPLLLADAAHTAGDLFVTGLALASLATVHLGLAWMDPALAIVVAAVIAWSGWQILRVTVPVLVDERGVAAERVRDAAVAVVGVTGTRAIRSRVNSAGTVFVEVTITVARGLDVSHAHAIADAVEHAIGGALGAADVTVHVEPD